MVALLAGFPFVVGLALFFNSPVGLLVLPFIVAQHIKLKREGKI